MATIFYSVMGEGRGHAARAATMVEQLRDRHRLVLYSSHDALAFLRDKYVSSNDVEVRALEGLKFHYAGGRLDLVKTIREGLSVWWRVNRLLAPLVDDFERDQPDLVVCDFEPLVARAAHRAGIPVLSLDHQHFLVAYDLSALPRRLQLWARSMSLAVWMFGIGQQKTVVSAFYQPPLRPGYEDVTQVGPLLRPTIRGRLAGEGDYLLSYLRRQTPPRVVDLLAQLDTPVRIYGLGERQPRGLLEFYEVDERSFTDSLVDCRAVVAAAGNQLLGEALYLGKPFFALPEEKHFEQCINAHFLKQLGGGAWAAIEHVELVDLQHFLTRIDAYRQNLAGRQQEFDGTAKAVAAIDSMLSK
ncbi:MAG: glycosyltransferase family protein [Aeoliella sp.]